MVKKYASSMSHTMCSHSVVSFISCCLSTPLIARNELPQCSGFSLYRLLLKIQLDWPKPLSLRYMSAMTTIIRHQLGLVAPCFITLICIGPAARGGRPPGKMGGVGEKGRAVGRGNCLTD